MAENNTAMTVAIGLLDSLRTLEWTNARLSEHNEHLKAVIKRKEATERKLLRVSGVVEEMVSTWPAQWEWLTTEAKVLILAQDTVMGRERNDQTGELIADRGPFHEER